MKINDNLCVHVHINITNTFTHFHLCILCYRRFKRILMLLCHCLCCLFISVWNLPYASLHPTAHFTHTQILLGALPIFVYTIAFQALTCTLDTCRSFLKMQSLIQCVWGGAWEVCISNKFPGDAAAAGT